MQRQPLTRRPRKLGRRPGETRTRDDILTAARAAFAEHGSGATVRAIAESAGVDPALIIHFFGSKDGLFVSAMEWPFAFEDAVEQIIAGPRSRMGRRLADFFLSIWDHPEEREPVVGLLRAATTNPKAAELLRDQMGRRLLRPIGEHLGGPDAALRITLCGSQLLGLGTARYIVRLEPLASLSAEEAAAAIAPTLQRYLTGPSPVP